MARKPPLRRSLPPEFKTPGDHFHQDIDFDAKTFPELAIHLAGCFSDDARSVPLAFLIDRVDFASAEDVKSHWNAACTDLWF
ncbi:hypothetical protein [Methylobacterium gossipiicola]|uniref:hypothetical protein n=1 Tax=Methylobacterium gossipiicola TaxID=582675 RepID=UPI0011609854|nr:hypothetical protein [Methylobacterium gossipiicola]